MTWVAVAIAGAGVLGAGASIYSGSKQSGAAGQASQVQLQMQRLQQQQLQPYTEAGYGAAQGLKTGLGIGVGPYHGGYDPNSPLGRPFTLQDFQQSPGYQFNLSQGLDAINKQAASRGNYYAPQTLQDIGRFSQGLASNEFNTERNAFIQNQQQQFGQLYSLANLGESAAAGVGAGALQTGFGVGNNIQSGAAAQAGGVMGAANALSGIPLSLLLAQRLNTASAQAPVYATS